MDDTWAVELLDREADALPAEPWYADQLRRSLRSEWRGATSAGGRLSRPRWLWMAAATTVVLGTAVAALARPRVDVTAVGAVAPSPTAVPVPEPATTAPEVTP